MSSDCVDNSAADDGADWDYKCPQFCDLMAVETTAQLRQMDHFFECNHEVLSPQSVGQQLGNNHNKTLVSDLKGESMTDRDVLRYETPPQNKENVVDTDDNEIFYSTKKYMSGGDKRSAYKFRATPMRTLQHNGSTPLRETRLTSSKKKKRSNRLRDTGDEGVFQLDDLAEALPTSDEIVETPVVEIIEISNECQLFAAIDEEVDELVEEVVENVIINEEQNEEHNVLLSDDEDVIQNDDQNEEQNELFSEEEEVNENNAEVNDNAVEDEVFATNDNELVETAVNITLTGRESYVIEKIDSKSEKKPQKSVTLVSPEEAAKYPKRKSSTRRRGTPIRKSILSSHRKGTPIQKSILSSKPKPRNSEVVSRLYSTAKKPTNCYKTMAELLREFETEPRGRSSSVDRTVQKAPNGMGSRSSSTSSMTRPKSPKLHSILRHRRTPRPTEDIIASQIKKHSFKANPIRKKLFDAKFASGIPKIKSSKEPTKAVEMHFQTERRNQLRSTNETQQQQQPKPMPFKAHPMPEFKSFQVQARHTERKPTTFKPFSFDHKIQDLVLKKRTLSDDLNYMKREVIAKPFKF